MTTPVIKILLLGDYSIFRSALRMLIETDKRLRVVGEAVGLVAAEAIIEEEKPDIILVDLPELDGDELLPSFNHKSIPVLVLIGQHDVEVYKRCLKLGISGLIPKEGKSDTLFKAIEKIHSGEIWFDRTVMGDTIRQLMQEKQFMHENPKPHVSTGLTEREQQVVELICKGLKNKEIADQLFITETTVRHHLTSVFSKLEITSRLELVIYAFKHNLVTPPIRSGRSNGKNGSNQMMGAVMF